MTADLHTLPVLETERLLLRPFAPDDLGPVHRMHSDIENVRFTSGRTKDRQESREWLEWAIGSYERHGHGFWALDLKPGGEFIGHAGLLAQVVDDVEETEIAYSILRERWGQGLATEAAVMSRDYGFDVLGRSRMISIIHPENHASRRVAEKVGLRPEKRTVRKGVEVVIYSIERGLTSRV